MSMEAERSNFIWDAIDEDLKAGRYERVHTRFPPEPNGYLHIGHCKALVTDFDTAERYNGLCNLRFDDTNPEKEETEFVDGIMEDIRWLGFDWNGGLFFASDYYQQCYDIAEDFIRRGLAYVDELSQEEMREYRGTLTQPGKNSPPGPPHGGEPGLFRRMKAGEFPEGSYVLRAKIDMASPTSTCATRSCTGFCTKSITAPAMNGASIPCMTIPIPWGTPSSTSPTACVPSNMRTTARCMTGWWKRRASGNPIGTNWAPSPTAPGRLSLPGLTSPGP